MDERQISREVEKWRCKENIMLQPNNGNESLITRETESKVEGVPFSGLLQHVGSWCGISFTPHAGYPMGLDTNLSMNIECMVIASLPIDKKTYGATD